MAINVVTIYLGSVNQISAQYPIPSNLSPNSSAVAQAQLFPFQGLLTNPSLLPGQSPMVSPSPSLHQLRQIMALVTHWFRSYLINFCFHRPVLRIYLSNSVRWNFMFASHRNFFALILSPLYFKTLRLNFQFSISLFLLSTNSHYEKFAVLW